MFDFSGMLDIVRFIETAEKLDLNVIVRPGPYICAEWEFGGLPSWLLSYPNLALRCDDEQYLPRLPFLKSEDEQNAVPAFLRGNLRIEGAPKDTFVRFDGFTKGFCTVNGFNLGRYYNPAGLQKTLYVPAPILKEGDNEIIVFEGDGYDKPVIEFTDTPVLNAIGE